MQPIILSRIFIPAIHFREYVRCNVSLEMQRFIFLMVLAPWIMHQRARRHSLPVSGERAVFFLMPHPFIMTIASALRVLSRLVIIFIRGIFELSSNRIPHYVGSKLISAVFILANCNNLYTLHLSVISYHRVGNTVFFIAHITVMHLMENRG